MRGEGRGLAGLWTRLEERHASLLLEALLLLTRWRSYCLTRKHAGCSQGASARLQFVRLTGGKKRDETSPFIFLECQKGTKGLDSVPAMRHS